MTFKRVASGIALAALWLLACAVTFLPGCASTGSLDKVGAFAAVATVAYIDQVAPAKRIETAARIVEVVKVVELAAADDAVPLETLVQIARDAFPADMPPARRVLALELLAYVQGEIQGRVAAGTLVNVRQVLAKVRLYATLYAPAS